MLNKTLISLLAFLIILSSCARAPKEISLKDSQERVDQDLLKIEKIKKSKIFQNPKLPNFTTVTTTTSHNCL